ncbi:hypothetical protein V6Z12_A04G136000 [Gossypium hirsutum]
MATTGRAVLHVPRRPFHEFHSNHHILNGSHLTSFALKKSINKTLEWQRSRGKRIRGHDGLKLKQKTRKQSRRPLSLRNLRTKRCKKSTQAFDFVNVRSDRETTFLERMKFVAKVRLLRTRVSSK